MKLLKIWIEAMRLRTLPVSVAGVIAGVAYGAAISPLRWGAAAACLAFAVLAQIASNFANEYFDYRDGLDRPGREGPRRGVTEGDISPRAMLTATLLTLGLACACGCVLIAYSGWWLIIAGVVIALAALAYSAGPWPLSRHGLGEVTVILFFGIVPVMFSCYLQCGSWPSQALLGSVAIGLMGANVLLVNNYRDRADDRAVGKTTVAVLLGPNATLTLYFLNGAAACALVSSVWRTLNLQAVPVVYLIVHTILFLMLIRRTGRALNPLLGLTAMLMLLYSITFAIVISLHL
ncbi:MAG: 1,4-dihydroxy-2-naphthoate octaprenyltransferase [Paramuribaculum sp.]|nr:1,4-dihydroxy-2-naphthoate octaprenyltransferase [Paramuribaculum sp.]